MMYGQLGEYKTRIALELEAGSGKEKLKMVTDKEWRVQGCERRWVKLIGSFLPGRGSTRKEY